MPLSYAPPAPPRRRGEGGAGHKASAWARCRPPQEAAEAVTSLIRCSSLIGSYTEDRTDPCPAGWVLRDRDRHLACRRSRPVREDRLERGQVALCVQWGAA